MSKRSFKLLSFYFLLLPVMIFFNSQCGESQNKVRSQVANVANAVNVGVIRENSVENPAKVFGETPSFTFEGDDWENAFLNQPAPRVFLCFSDKSGSAPASAEDCRSKTDLPDEAKKIVETYWRSDLKYHLDDEIDPPDTAQKSYDREIQGFRNMSKASVELQKININTPNGTRKISYEEALDIVGFISGAAISESKEMKLHKK